MTGGKKWLTVITEEQYGWIKDTAEKVELKGSDIIREILDRIMAEDQKKFRASLADMQLKIQLQKINDQKAVLAEAEQAIKKRMSSERVTA